jgi:antitoxin component YwqK of YwqJK toxin-antitoxin module
MNAMNWKCAWVVPVVGMACLLGLTTSGRHAAEAAQGRGTGKASIRQASEIIRERFPDGGLKIEREVTIDGAGNYVNHGAWRMWDPGGQLVAKGRYEMGLRTGLWMRRFNRAEAAVLYTAPFDQFDAPFVARASFKADKLDGEWSIVDVRERKCSRVTLKYGKRNGPATMWLPDGTVYREAMFRNGSPVGELRELDAQGRLNPAATYLGGRQLVNKVAYFPESQLKQSEVSCLVATVIEVAPDDFWLMRFAEYQVEREELRHGDWKCWYSNGKQQAAGCFQFDREMGVFTWWHAHGQEAVKGGYIDGQPDGIWTWWHANGQKAAEGYFHTGQQAGVWRRWTEDGQLMSQHNVQAAFDAGNVLTGEFRSPSKRQAWTSQDRAWPK